MDDELMASLTLNNLKGKPHNGNKIIVPSGHNIIIPGHVIQVARHKWNNPTSVTGNNVYADCAGGSFTFAAQHANSRLLIVLEASLNSTQATSSSGGSMRIVHNGVALDSSAQAHEHYSSGGGDTSQDFYERFVKSSEVLAGTTDPVEIKAQIAAYSTATARCNVSSYFWSYLTVWEIGQ